MRWKFPADRIGLLLSLGAVGACAEAPREAGAPQRSAAAAAATAAPIAVGPAIAGFYADRGHRPLWVAGDRLRPEAVELIGTLARAADHGLDPERYHARELAALASGNGGDRQALARAELLLSHGFTAFVRDLRTPQGENATIYVDKSLAPSAPSVRSLLDAAAAAPSLAGYVAEATRMNPLYEALRRGRARWRAAGARPPAEERLVLANLDRARAIAPHKRRYIIVDAVSARLWMMEGSRVVDQMRVVVGRPNMQTPAMAALIRYAALNPYWNVPPDLARERARRVLRQGTGILARERMELLSDWGTSAHVIKASQVNWGAVAAGRETLRMRQLPGGNNSMGAVKFMMPNKMGIYLHDFPDKSLFARHDRRISSGCVRLEDAQRLSRWLFGGNGAQPNGPRPEQRVNLPEPVPVYITYLTVLPEPGPAGVTIQPDAYGRDRPLFAALGRPTQLSAL